MSNQQRQELTLECMHIARPFRVFSTYLGLPIKKRIGGFLIHMNNHYKHYILCPPVVHSHQSGVGFAYETVPINAPASQRRPAAPT